MHSCETTLLSACVCLYVYPLYRHLNASTNLYETQYVRYVMAPEPISTAYFINPSRKSLCLCVYPHIIARQALSKHVPAAKNTLAVFCAVRVVSKESLCIPLSLPGSGSVKHVPAAKKNCWRRYFFLCGPCHVKGK
jgi:hypothetical protein